MFDADYAEIARVLEKSEAAVRQTVHRARERVRSDHARFEAPVDATGQLFRRFVAALEKDDKEGCSPCWRRMRSGLVMVAER